jgi:hypothetical protein
MNRQILPVLLALTALSTPAITSADVSPSSRIDPWVLETTEHSATTEFIVFLREQADLSATSDIRSRSERGRAVFELLQGQARATQGPLLALLEAAGVEHRAYWVANMIWVRGDRALALRLAARDDVARIAANPSVRLADPMASPQAPVDVAGMAALLMSSQSCLERDVDAVEALMRKSAQPWQTNQSCGGIPGSEAPNNTYGYGEIRSALPGPDDCVAPVGAGAGGLNDGGIAICLVQGAGDPTVTPLDNALAVDCEAAGLAVNSGDRVIMVLRAAASGSDLKGTLTGVTGLFANCRNQVTGQTVGVPLGGANAWDCTAAGLNAAPGQQVQQVLVGTAQ